jgi:hypothetical protein
MKNHILISTTIVLLFLLIGCENDDESPMPAIELAYSFNEGTEGWVGGVSDYHMSANNIDFSFEHAALPSPLDTESGALKLAGTNTSDDLFMFVKKEITGLTSNQPYQFHIEVTFASDESDGQVGIGGSPGESVFVKAGATTIEPEKMLNDNDMYRMNIDKGNQSQGGTDMSVIGDFSNDTDQNVYTLKTLSTTSFFVTTASDTGSAWVIIGTDSGFEGETEIYYHMIKVIATPL